MEPQKRFVHPTILLVDDLPENLKVLGNILLNNNYLILASTSGTKAIEIAIREKPDIILLDIQMPEIDGFEVCRRLKEIDKIREIPVIFISARSEINDVLKGFEAGGVDYITKPFQAKELLARIKTHVELKQAREKMSELIATKDKFITILAHDLKNPFNSLLGISEILKEEFDNLDKTEITEMVSAMENTIRKTYFLIENLLKWAMAHTGRINFIPVKFNLSDIVNDSLEVVKSQALNKSISIENNIIEPIYANADKQMIENVLINLVSNAIKFTNKGGKVKLAAKSDHEKIIISVIDNGIGISEKQINSLFQIDSKFTSAGTEKETGTGLGLLICKEFVEINNGIIWVESTEMEGSTFNFTLPNT